MKDAGYAIVSKVDLSSCSLQSNREVRHNQIATLVCNCTMCLLLSLEEQYRYSNYEGTI
jgi:hypothetical protein